MVISDKCPFETALKTAESTVTEAGEAHFSPETNLGSIGLTRSLLEQIAGQLDCTGPQLNGAGQLVCPLVDAVTSARAYATAPVSKGAFVVDLPSYVEGHDINQNQSGNGQGGQYL